jgi:hypothetical protein
MQDTPFTQMKTIALANYPWHAYSVMTLTLTTRVPTLTTPTGTQAEMAIARTRMPDMYTTFGLTDHDGLVGGQHQAALFTCLRHAWASGQSDAEDPRAFLCC